MDPRRLDDGAHGAAADHPGAGDRGLQQHLGGALLVADLVGDGGAHHGHSDHVLLGVLDTLADGVGDLARLAETRSHAPLAIAHHHQGAEGEATAALHHLGDTVEGDHLLLKVGATAVVAAIHAHSHRQNSRPAERAASASALTRPW